MGGVCHVRRKPCVRQQPFFPRCLEVQPHPYAAVLKVEMLAPLLRRTFDTVPRREMSRLAVVDFSRVAMAY